MKGDAIYMTNKEESIYDTMVALGITTEEELNLARRLVSGTWEEVLARVLYIRTGYRSMDQMAEEDPEEEES
jgi:hypothetical protein